MHNTFIHYYLKKKNIFFGRGGRGISLSLNKCNENIWALVDVQDDFYFFVLVIGP